MTFGVERPNQQSELSRGAQRKSLLELRDDKIAELMERRRPVNAIAKIIGMEPVQCRKAVHRIAEERGVDYQPIKEPVIKGVLTDASRRFRNNLASILYSLREAPGAHPLEISLNTGLTQAQVAAAIDKGGLHDFRLSELERVATLHKTDFTNLVLKAVLSPEQYEKVVRCLNS